MDSRPHHRGMRVIFLDLDGTLHSAGGPPGFMLPFEWLDELAGLLAEHPDVRIVIHSSWRETFSIDELYEFLGSMGDRLDGVVGRGAKSAAITEYLQNHPEINDAAVLDDEPEDLQSVLNAVIVPCDPKLGISSPATQETLKAWLQRGPA